MSKVLKITQIKGGLKAEPKQDATIRSLGLRGLGTTVYRADLKAIRGMLNKVQHVIEAVQVNGPVKPEKKLAKKTYRIVK